MLLVQDEWDPLYEKVLRDLQTRFASFLVQSNGRHVTCSRRECDPQCHESNVYMCKYGTVHICSASRCEYYQHTQSKTCPISGIVHQSVVLSHNTYDKNDSRTWRKESELVAVTPEQGVTTTTTSRKKDRRTHNRQHINVEALRQQAENTIIKLLYSSNRADCNEAARLQLDEKAKKARQTYVNERYKKRQLPYLTDLMRITAAVFTQPLPYSLFHLNNTLVRYYVEVVMQVWALVIKHAIPHKHKVFDERGKEMLPRIDFESVVLATLYAMREGMEFEEGCVALPRDEFLYAHLPALNDLDAYFGLSQNQVTLGTTLLLEVYNNARKDGATLEEISLNMSSLPSKDEADGVEAISERAAKRAAAIHVE